MDKIPGFHAFDEKIKSIVEGIKEAWYKKKILMLFVYIIFVIFVIITSVSLLIGAIVGGWGALGLIKDNIYEPKRQLIYERKGEPVINNVGEYVTIFTLKLFDPAGNLSKFIYTHPKGCPDNLNYIDGGVEFREGITYAVGNYEVICITKEPIEENYELFELKR